MLNVITLGGEVISDGISDGIHYDYSEKRLDFVLKVNRPFVDEYEHDFWDETKPIDQEHDADYFNVVIFGEARCQNFLFRTSFIDRHDYVTVTGRLRLTKRDGGGYDGSMRSMSFPRATTSASILS